MSPEFFFQCTWHREVHWKRALRSQSLNQFLITSNHPNALFPTGVSPMHLPMRGTLNVKWDLQINCNGQSVIMKWLLAHSSALGSDLSLISGRDLPTCLGWLNVAYFNLLAQNLRRRWMTRKPAKRRNLLLVRARPRTRSLPQRWRKRWRTWAVTRRWSGQLDNEFMIQTSNHVQASWCLTQLYFEVVSQSQFSSSISV